MTEALVELLRALTGIGWRMPIPRRARLAYWLHARIGRLAWRFARPEGPEWGIGLRIDHDRLLWKLNDYAADQWFRWWMWRVHGYRVPRPDR